MPDFISKFGRCTVKFRHKSGFLQYKEIMVEEMMS